jgi:CRISPR system Cascade subunit CasC
MAMEKDGGLRTRSLIRELGRRASDNGNPAERTLKLVRKVFEDAGVEVNATKGDPTSTNIVMFLPDSAVTEMARLVKLEVEKAKPSAGDLAAALAPHLAKAGTPDIALSGRMTEFDAKGAFEGLDFSVEAALSAAHAISTHEAINETDYWTAADDLPSGAAAAMVNEASFASACFYKYFAIDHDQLLKNLAENFELATLAVRQFVQAAATSTPSGKQHACAAFNLPEGVLVEVKRERCIPTSYANAFVDPVPARCERGLIGESVARLGQYVHDTAVGFGIPANRFWFSPGGRHRLAWVDRAAKGAEKEKPVVDGAAVFASLEEILKAVTQAIAPTVNATEER